MTETDKKQIEEMAIVMCEDCADYGDCKYNVCDCVRESASTLYKAGYRRQNKAKWKYTKTLPMRGPVYQCTNCKEEYNRQALSMKRCPDCGAIMEGEE